MKSFFLRDIKCWWWYRATGTLRHCWGSENWPTSWKNVILFTPGMWASNSAPQCTPIRSVCKRSPSVYKNVHGSKSCNGWKTEPAQMPISGMTVNRLHNVQTMEAAVNNSIQCVWILQTCFMKEPRLKEFILCDIFDMRFRNRQN